LATVPPRGHQPDPGDRPQWTAARPGARSSSRGQRDTQGALPRHPHAVWPLDLQIARIANNREGAEQAQASTSCHLGLVMEMDVLGIRLEPPALRAWRGKPR